MSEDVDSYLAKKAEKTFRGSTVSNYEIGNSMVNEIREVAKNRFLKKRPGWTYVPGRRGNNVCGQGGYGLWAVRIDNVARGCLTNEITGKYNLLVDNDRLLARSSEDAENIRKESNEFLANKDDKALGCFLKYHNAICPEEISHSFGYKLHNKDDKTKKKNRNVYKFFRDFANLEPRVNAIYLE